MSGPLGGNGNWGCSRGHRGQKIRVLRNDERWVWLRCEICGHGWKSKAWYARVMARQQAWEPGNPMDFL